MNNGKKLEMDFINAIDKHKFKDLNLNLQKFTLFLFDDINYETMLHCKKLGVHQKADICIEIDNISKYISIKTGSQNSVHVEKIESFKNFLLDIGTKQNIVDNLLIYHYGDDTLTGNGKIRYSAEEAKSKYKEQILSFNKNINYSKNLYKIIDRILFIGSKSSNKKVDAIYYGDLDIGTWCSSEELLKYCIIHKSMYMNTPHFSFLTYQNWCRNISRLKKSESHREYIQIKWFSILSDIKKIRQSKDIIKNTTSIQ